MTTTFAAGNAVDYKGQQYRCLAVEPYTRKDGKPSKVAVVQSLCAECAQPFQFKIAAKVEKFMPNRRCAEHVRPRARVSKRQLAHLANAAILRDIGL